MSTQTSASPPGTDLAAVQDGVRTYHGRPVLKEPAWTWEVPWYLFFGGMAGALSVLAAGATLTGRHELARRARIIAALGAGVSPPLLIADLGRPARFLHMLRVFKPTSVMSVGSWILAGYSGAANVAVGLAEFDRMPRLRFVSDVGAGVLGSGMLTYTGALVADTAIPVWHEARRELPALFAASGMASAGAAATLATPPRHAGPARRLAVAGAALELGVDKAMRTRLGAVGDVYEHEEAGRFHKAAVTATAMGGALIAAGGARRRLVTAAGCVAVLGGSICQRWAVYRAGFQSARDPKATIGPQRDRLRRGEGHRGGEPVGHGAGLGSTRFGSGSLRPK